MQQVLSTENKEAFKRIVISLEDKDDEKALILDLLRKANDKEYGDEIKPQDLFLMGLKGLTDKHIDKLKEQSITPKQRLIKAYNEAVTNDNFKGSLEEFLCIRAKI